MSDIVFELRYADSHVVNLRDKAADEIEKLRAELKRSHEIGDVMAEHEKNRNAELSELRAANEWKPIETMPQDGSNFDVFIYDTTTVINKCHTDAANNVWVRHGYPTVTTLIKDATHWKPITHPK